MPEAAGQGGMGVARGEPSEALMAAFAALRSDTENKRAGRSGDHRADAVATAILTVERSLQDFCARQVEDWAKAHLRSLTVARDLDNAVLTSQASLTIASLDRLRKLHEPRRWERQRANEQFEESIRDCEAAFTETMQSLGDQYRSHAGDVVKPVADSMIQHMQGTLEIEWEVFHHNLCVLVWERAREFAGINFGSDSAVTGETHKILPDLEKQLPRWLESFTENAVGLLDSIEQESSEAFSNLRLQLAELKPESSTAADPSIYLPDVMESQKAEIVASLTRCDEDYRGYSFELQKVLLRMVEERARVEKELLQLHIAKCHWRLDYQRSFHEQKAKLKKRQVVRGDEDVACAKEHFDTVRQLTLDLWQRKRTPEAEIRTFLERVADVALEEGLADKLAGAHKDELKRFGGLPLLDHVDNPDFLDCWMASISEKSRRDVRWKRPNPKKEANAEDDKQ